MTQRELRFRAIKGGVRISLGALSLLATSWHIHASSHTGGHPRPNHLRNQARSPASQSSAHFRSGFGDHLSDIAKLATNQSRQADLLAWKRRVDFLAAQPGITDIRVDFAAPDVTVVSKGHLLWNRPNLDVYGAAFDYAASKHLNIILIAMPPFRAARTGVGEYRSMISSYYNGVGVFAKGHHIVDIDINELGAHDPATGRPPVRVTKQYLARVVGMVATASHAVKKYVPHATIIVSESAAMTEDATKRLLAVFSALKQTRMPFVVGLNIYAGGPVEIGEIAPLVHDVDNDGQVWVTEFGWASVGAHAEAMEAERIGEIFEAVIKAGVRRAIGYEEMDEPRLKNLDNVQPAEKNYGIVWRDDGSIKPAAGVFLSIARDGIGKRRGA